MNLSHCSSRFLATVVLFLTVALPASAQKTDIVLLENGDYVTCEIKRLEYGILRCGTSFIGTIEIKWEHVETLISNKGLQIEVTSGERHFGSLTEPSEHKKLRVTSLTESTELEMLDVVRIEPINDGIFKKLDGSLSLGFSYTKSSDVGQLNFNGSSSYRTRKRLATMKLDSIFTSQANEPTSKRNDLSFTLVRYYQNKWFTRFDAGANQNDELGIELRATVGSGGGRILQQSNHGALEVSALLAANNEQVTNGEATNNLEAAFELLHRLFRHDSPKTSLTTSLVVYPSLSNFGRVRGNFNTNLRQELIKDFFWDLNGYYDYDSEPAAGEPANDDYGIVTSFGWTF